MRDDAESHQRQLVDAFRSYLQKEQIDAGRRQIPPTAVGGYFQIQPALLDIGR